MLHFNYYPTSLLRASDFKIKDKKIYGATGVSKRGRKRGIKDLRIAKKRRTQRRTSIGLTTDDPEPAMR